MTQHRTLSDALSWMTEGTIWIQGYVNRLTDADFAEDSRLPGWTRGHLVAHLAKNAEALTRLLIWARTGVETPMYANAEQRAAEIESGAHETPAVLREAFMNASERLSSAVQELPREAWSFEVRSALGRTIPASEVPWLRTREVWLHGFDLGTGAQLDEIPSPVAIALVEDITQSFASRVGAVSMRLRVIDSGNAESTSTTFTIGEDGEQVTGTPADLVGWLSGRTQGEGVSCDDALPTIPPWL
jgi:maleylpyruvate isomerase